MAAIFALTVVMCILSAFAAIVAGGAYRSRRGLHPMSAPVLEALGVNKVLGSGAGQVHALKDVNLTLHGGELTMLMGPSGSGKTTLLSVLGCMLAPTAGTRARRRRLDRRRRS